MSDTDGLICAYLLDGNGVGRKTDWEGVRTWTPADGLLWVHLDWTAADATEWLNGPAGLDPLVAQALTAEETRPRAAIFEDGVLVILRGVNFNEGADPADMVSIRVWIDGARIVSTRRSMLMAVNDLRADLESGKGARTGPGFIIRLAQRLTDRVLPVEDDIADALDDMEDQLVAGKLDELGETLTPLRRETIALRRHLSPQRDALTRLYVESEDWFDATQRARIREVGDRVYRIVEELDAMRERAAVVQDERRTRISERMDRAIYLLSIIATIMLPLTFVTGLLGMNVGGIPGDKVEWAFWGVCGGLGAVGVLLIILFRRIRWL